MAELPKQPGTGIPSIDEDHRRLLDQLNVLSGALGNSPQSAEFSEALSRLTCQLLEHFASEERLMRFMAVPGELLARHIDAHNEVIEQITQLSFDLMKRRKVERTEVVAKVHAWVFDHLSEYDLELKTCSGTFANTKGQD